MLRNRSTKQALMSDHTKKNPRFFKGLLTKSLSCPETTLMSPTSILDTKNSPNFVNPFAYEQQNLPKFPEINAQNPPQAIGLALIDSLTDEKTDVKFSKPINRMVLFGSKLKVQIPAINPISPVESPKSPADFGIKTKNSQLLLSPLPETPSKDFSRQLSLKEMELSEDYTCVITHGPNPKTTHIFDNCIVECCCGEDMIKSCGLNSNFSISTSSNCKDEIKEGRESLL